MVWEFVTDHLRDVRLVPGITKLGMVWKLVTNHLREFQISFWYNKILQNT